MRFSKIILIFLLLNNCQFGIRPNFTIDKNRTDLVILANKNIYLFGDSITVGNGATMPYTELITDELHMNRVFADNNGDFALIGTTMMSQSPKIL